MSEPRRWTRSFKRTFPLCALVALCVFGGFIALQVTKAPSYKVEAHVIFAPPVADASYMDTVIHLAQLRNPYTTTITRYHASISVLRILGTGPDADRLGQEATKTAQHIATTVERLGPTPVVIGGTIVDVVAFTTALEGQPTVTERPDNLVAYLFTLGLVVGMTWLLAVSLATSLPRAAPTPI